MAISSERCLLFDDELPNTDMWGFITKGHLPS